MKRSIDNVTVENLDICLRLIEIKLTKKQIDDIIDIVELIEKKGDQTTVQDISNLVLHYNCDKQQKIDTI